MPHAKITLTGGVNTHETAALNQTGITASNLIRIKPDAGGALLVEMIGGWTKYYSGTLATLNIVEFLAWEDTNANKWLAFGSAAAAGNTSLGAIQCTVAGVTSAPTTNVFDLSPTYYADTITPVISTTAGSAIVTITDPYVSPVNSFDSVYFSTQICVGGLVLFGTYACTNITYNQYSIVATDVFGNITPATFTNLTSAITVTGGSFAAGTPPLVTLTWASPAYTFTPGDYVNVSGGIAPNDWSGAWIVSSSTSTSVTFYAPTATTTTYTSGGSISNFGNPPIVSGTYSATSPTNLATVTMPNHGFFAGSTFPVLNSVYVGGVQLLGNYVVKSVINSYTFTTLVNNSFSATASTFLNSLTAFSGSSTASVVTLNVSIDAETGPSIMPTSGSSTTTLVTLTWASPLLTFTVGRAVWVNLSSGPAAWSGVSLVTAATPTSVTYAVSGSALGATAITGTISGSPFYPGQRVSVSGATPSAWNGVQLLTGVTYAPVYPSGWLALISFSLSGAATSLSSVASVSAVGGFMNNIYILGNVPSYQAVGYGLGQYGSGSYGTGSGASTSIVGQKISTTNWSLANWGQVLIANPVGFAPVGYAGTPTPYTYYQPIFIWDPTSYQTYATVLPAAPPVSTGVIVAMPQRQIIAWGTSFTGIVDPLLVRWCDVNNYNVWVGQITNQAGSYRLPSGSTIVDLKQVSQQIFIWTDIGLWAMQYISTPYIYSFTQIGFGCGLISRRAAGTLNGVTYWMGPKGFFMYSGEGVTAVVCPVWDYIFQQFDQTKSDNIICAPNSMFQEITWYFPVIGGGGVNTMYAKYSVLANVWDIGTLSRSAWMDTTILGPPIAYDTANSVIVQHETSQFNNSTGTPQTIPASFTTGYAAIGDGDSKIFVDQLWPDFKYSYYGGTLDTEVRITFTVADYPAQGATQTFGPYILSYNGPPTYGVLNYLTPRFRGRLVSYTIDTAGTQQGWWRMGAIRYRYQLDGKI